MIPVPCLPDWPHAAGIAAVFFVFCLLVAIYARRNPLQRYPVTIDDHAGHKVFFYVSELDESIDADIDRFTSQEARQANNYDPVLARWAVLRRAISGLKIDGKSYVLGSEKKAPPRLGRDPETGKKLSDALLGHVIRHNPFLVEEDDYRDHFEEYALDDQEVPDRNPTHFRAVGE